MVTAVVLCGGNAGMFSVVVCRGLNEDVFIGLVSFHGTCMDLAVCKQQLRPVNIHSHSLVTHSYPQMPPGYALTHIAIVDELRLILKKFFNFFINNVILTTFL